MIKVMKSKKLNLITSLRKLFKAFSKEDTDSNNVADLVDKIADSVSKNTVTNAVLYTEQMLTTEQQLQARANIGAVSLDEIGTIFKLKGEVATVADLSASGNRVGDMYYVKAVSAGYIWLISETQPNGYWEELDETFDITIDSELSSTSKNPVQNKVINAALAEKGTYSKPSNGIPKSDLASAVQTSLEKANTALQSVPTGYATETWVTNKGYQTAAQVRTAISDVKQLPVVSTSDNGKFLRVVSGVWTAVAMPSAETASF